MEFLRANSLSHRDGAGERESQERCKGELIVFQDQRFVILVAPNSVILCCSCCGIPVSLIDLSVRSQSKGGTSADLNSPEESLI